MKILALIPARGGSKRLPRKNIIDFLGIPIMAYTIKAAIQTELFEKIIVSTEDQEIAEVAHSYGAQTIMRPQYLATDTAGVVDVCLHALEEEKRRGKKYDILCCLLATAPLRSAEDIANTVNLVQTGKCEFAIAVTNYHFPPHQALVLTSEGYMKPMWPKTISKKSQEVPELLVDNGSTYAALVSNFLKKKSFYGKKLMGYQMSRLKSVDIDEQEDLLIAKKFAPLQKEP